MGDRVFLVVSLFPTQNLPLRLIPLNFVSLLSEALLLMPIPCAPGVGDRAKEPLRWMLRPREAEERPREALVRGREAAVRGREAALFCFFFISAQQKKSEICLVAATGIRP